MSKKKRQQKQKELLLQARLLLPMLSQHYPEVFTPDAVVPLAIGIHQEILIAVPAIPPLVLATFLRWWTNRLHYLKAVRQPGSHRIHLDGIRQTAITDEERVYTRKKIRAYWYCRKRKAWERHKKMMETVEITGTMAGGFAAPS